VFRADPTDLQLPNATRLEDGRSRRQRAPRTSHRIHEPAVSRPDPLDLLEQQHRARLAELVPVRWGRMAQSPFAFLRGAAVVMAHDLSTTPTTGLTVQACGDAHLLNFGAFASHERRNIFDLNDFDETLPGPWEWDLKRLTASAVVAALDNGCSRTDAAAAARSALVGYHDAMKAAAEMPILDVWYFQFELGTTLLDRLPKTSRPSVKRATQKMERRTAASLLPKLTTLTDGGRRIIDRPPLIMHVDIDHETERVRDGFAQYVESLSPDRRMVLHRFKLVDIARKVVGVGSVGTRCHVLLLLSPDGEPLFLQSKEAPPSVLEPYCGSPFTHGGQRVVTGQRLTQVAGDPFLGWTTVDSFELYLRQLRDRKFSFDISTFDTKMLQQYLDGCGIALARAHARTGDPSAICGYLGSGESFNDAVVDWSLAYADQTIADHARLVAAIEAGQINALEGV